MTDKTDERPRKLNANAGHYAWNILFTRIINLSFFVRRTQNSTITDQGKRKFEKKLTTPLLPDLYYYMRNFCNLIGLEQWKITNKCENYKPFAGSSINK